MVTVVKLSDQLIELAKPYAIAGHRSVPEQIEFWARLGKTAEENPELPTLAREEKAAREKLAAEGSDAQGSPAKS